MTSTSIPLSEYVSMIRNAEIFMGTKKKKIENCEYSNRQKMRKSMILDNDGNYIIKRPPLIGKDPWDWEP